jgi:hypothetical protein
MTNRANRVFVDAITVWSLDGNVAELSVKLPHKVTPIAKPLPRVQHLPACNMPLRILGKWVEAQAKCRLGQVVGCSRAVADRLRKVHFGEVKPFSKMIFKIIKAFLSPLTSNPPAQWGIPARRRGSR